MAKSPTPSSELASRRMRNTPTRNTPAELALRSLLHSSGLRYRVDLRPLKDLRRKADIVFTRQRVAVFVDGCFWHSCPQHGSSPKANAEWWRDKLGGNVARDRDTDHRLKEAGWRVIRVWEHEDMMKAAAQIAMEIRTKRDTLDS